MSDPRRIYLTGLRGTGKTTVGKIISSALDAVCVDLDVVIERAAAKSIREIFQDDGEPAFRDWETKCLTDVASREASEPGFARVIALGGGAIVRPENRQLIRQSGVCVWLIASPETLAGRMETDATTTGRRPALTELSPVEEIAKVLADRRDLYQDVSDHQIDTEQRSPEQVAESVLTWLSNRTAST